FPDILPYIEDSHGNIPFSGFAEDNHTRLLSLSAERLKNCHFAGIIAPSDTGVLSFSSVPFIIRKCRLFIAIYMKKRLDPFKFPGDRQEDHRIMIVKA